MLWLPGQLYWWEEVGCTFFILSGKWGRVWNWNVLWHLITWKLERLAIPVKVRMVTGLRRQARSSGKSGWSWCLDVLSYCAFCLSHLSWNLTLINVSICRKWGLTDSWQVCLVHSAIQKLCRWWYILTKWSALKTKHNQMRVKARLHALLQKIFYSLHCRLN